MQDMSQRYEYGYLMWEIPIYDVKSKALAGWLLQIENVALLTNIRGYELAMATFSIQWRARDMKDKSNCRCIIQIKVELVTENSQIKVH